jgi:hypothetical protein
MTVQITTRTSHEHADIHLSNEDIEMGSFCLTNSSTIVLNIGFDLNIFLSPEQAETLHEAIGEALLSSRLESLVK